MSTCYVIMMHSNEHDPVPVACTDTVAKAKARLVYEFKREVSRRGWNYATLDKDHENAFVNGDGWSGNIGDEDDPEWVAWEIHTATRVW